MGSSGATGTLVLDPEYKGANKHAEGKNVPKGVLFVYKGLN